VVELPEGFTGQEVGRRQGIGVESDLDVVIRMERDADIFESGPLQQTDDLHLLIRIQEPVQDESLFAALECRFMLNDELQVLDRLATLVPGMEVVTDDPVEDERILAFKGSGDPRIPTSSRCWTAPAL